jgi:hypothetical protein
MSSLDARERACNMAELFMRVDYRDIWFLIRGYKICRCNESEMYTNV